MNVNALFAFYLNFQTYSKYKLINGERGGDRLLQNGIGYDIDVFGWWSVENGVSDLII